MEKHIRLLAALLGVQVLLALAFWIGGTTLSAKTSDTPLLALEGKTVERLTIEDSEQAKVMLAKIDGAWRLPEQGDFPADRDKIERLLTRLKELKQGPPVAKTVGAQERFKVSDENFERRISLASASDTLATLYLGTSPAMRQTHAREAGGKTIHAVELATYDVPVKPDDWEDKAVLQIPKDEIAAIEVNGLRLERAPDTGDRKANDENDNKTTKPSATAWQLVGESKHAPNSEAAEKLAGLLAQLRIGAVLGKKEQTRYGLKTPRLTLSVVRKDGPTAAYRIGKMKDKEDYVLKVSTRSEYFRLPSYTAEPLIEAAKRETLLDSGKAEATAAP